MKICVMGLWHLGIVTAACLAAEGNIVVGVDFEPEVVGKLNLGKAPIFEPGLEDLLSKGLINGTLSFTTEAAKAISSADIIWITYDTPVNERDQADSAYVLNRVKQIFPYLKQEEIVIISSQLPAGTTRCIECEYRKNYPDTTVFFNYLPENLRLGKAIKTFYQPDRVVLGTREGIDRAKLIRLLRPFTDNIEWMSVESAEMTKHALNSFLATSITFINEIAELCEVVGADAKEVERGLKSDSRIGQKAYLSPGSAYSGGTLARDVDYLNNIGKINQVNHHLIKGVQNSNKAHSLWLRRKMLDELVNMDKKVIAVWGLTYKPGTNTLRRSGAIELCRWLKKQGAIIQANDPSIIELPSAYAKIINLYVDPLDTLKNADTLLIATNWEDYKKVSIDNYEFKKGFCVFDTDRFLAEKFSTLKQVRYITVGKGLSWMDR